jgi:hypothetical protein
MKRMWFAPVCVGLALGLGAVSSGAGEKDESSKELSKDQKAARNIAIARQLVEYAREANSPESLLAAAKILDENPTRQSKEVTKSDGVLSVEPDSPLSLIEEAGKMRPDDADLKKILDRTYDDIKSARRGTLGGGSYSHTFILPARTGNDEPAFELVRNFEGGTGPNHPKYAVTAQTIRYVGDDPGKKGTVTTIQPADFRFVVRESPLPAGYKGGPLPASAFHVINGATNTPANLGEIGRRMDCIHWPSHNVQLKILITNPFKNRVCITLTTN